MEINKKNFEISFALKNLLGLRYAPVAVKFVKKEEEIKDYPSISLDVSYRYCQMIMEAKKGKICALSPINITCPAAAAAFGFESLPEKIAQGAMLKTLGLFKEEEDGRLLMEKIPRLKPNEIQLIIAMPLEKCTFAPDLIVIEDIPERAMWIALASLKDVNGRHSFSTGIFQACCVDVSVIPYLTQKVNASLGCYGCRDATDIKDDECLVGIPYSKIDSILSAIEHISKKAMITVRNKKALNAWNTDDKKVINNS